MMGSPEINTSWVPPCPDTSTVKTQPLLLSKAVTEVPLAKSPAQRIAEMAKISPRSSVRFGALSHHSFFSRHSPHPNRVKHIQGLNGSPVCIVNDDWYLHTPLYPHPLIKSQVNRSFPGLPGPQPPFGALNINSKSGSALLSEAWKEELKYLAAKVSMSTQPPKSKKDRHTKDDASARRSQYSAETGRLVPPPTRALGRYGTRASLCRPGTHMTGAAQPLYDQELMVLEVLCQILQTDSLHLVQQWLLFAGQREKDMVMGLIQKAMANTLLPTQLHTAGHEQTALSSAPALPTRPSLIGQQQRHRTAQVHPKTSAKDKPERIGEAEVLHIHNEDKHTPDVSAPEQV
ncbi:protein TBATA isoform X2 [Denticeps clupeoides]|nr:protein TBATA isoform X2 [Denticeps clupeoides]